MISHSLLFFAQCNPNVVFLLLDYLDYLLLHHDFVYLASAVILKLNVAGFDILSERLAHTVKFTEVNIKEEIELPKTF